MPGVVEYVSFQVFREPLLIHRDEMGDQDNRERESEGGVRVGIDGSQIVMQPKLLSREKENPIQEQGEYIGKEDEEEHSSHEEQDPSGESSVSDEFRRETVESGHDDESGRLHHSSFILECSAE